MNKKADLNIEPGDLPDLIALVLLILGTTVAYNAGSAVAAGILVLIIGALFGRRYHFAQQNGIYKPLFFMTVLTVVTGLLLGGRYLPGIITVGAFTIGFFLGWIVHDKFPGYVE